MRRPSDQSNLRAILRGELERRCSADARYSLRSFARALAISHTTLSLVLSGRRSLSKKTRRRIARLLEIPARGVEGPDASEFDRVESDHQALIADWRHAAVLCLLETKRASSSARAIARAIGIQEAHARVILERLKRLGLVSHRGSQWARDRISQQVEGVSPARFPKKFHRSLMEKASHSLENAGEGKHRASSAVFAMDPALLPAMARVIELFQRRIRKQAVQKKPYSEVYALSIQLFPLTEPAD